MQTWSEYGKLAEYLVANHLLKRGYEVRVSKNSKGFADILAWNEQRLLIQVKASAKSAHIKAREVSGLQRAAENSNARAIVAVVVGNELEFYALDEWKKVTL